MPPVSLKLCSPLLYSRQSAFTWRSPCFISTLPHTRALPLTSNSKLSSSLWMVMGLSVASLRLMAGGAPVATAVVSGQGGSSANAAGTASEFRSRPANKALSKVSGTVAHYTYVNARARPAPQPHPDLADTRPGMAHRSHQRGIRRCQFPPLLPRLAGRRGPRGLGAPRRHTDR